jgi:uncharacterized protein (DUF58 family)
MDAVEIIKKVRKIELKMRSLTNNVLTGSYHSAFKGRGMAFDEVRAYQPGDDVRTIDWNVTARTGETFIKKYEEERELTVLLLVDISGSLFAGSAETTKNELVTEIAALIALSAIQNNDKVGLMLFGERPVFYLPPRTGKHQLLRIIREIMQTEAGHRLTDISKAMSAAYHLQKRRSICFVLSDFLDTDFETSLRVLAGRHEVIGVQISDALEYQIPNVGILQAQDPETGDIMYLDTHQDGARQEYKRIREATKLRTKLTFERNGTDYMDLRTDQPYFHTILQFFQKHGKKR